MTIATTTTRIPIKSIAITQLEGLIGTLKDVVFDCWENADRFILNQCADAPSDGTYHKHSVVATWSNDQTYSFRYDAARRGSPSHEGTISERIRSGLLYSAGLKCPAHVSESEYMEAIMDPRLDGRLERATAMLKTLAFNDDTASIPAPTKSAIDLAREMARKEVEGLRKAAPVAVTPPARIPAQVPDAPTRTITPAQVYRAAAAAPAVSAKPKGKDPVDSLPTTAMARRIKALITGASLIANDDPRCADQWSQVIALLNELKGGA